MDGTLIADFTVTISWNRTLGAFSENRMELRCSICKRKIDVESEVVAVFECYVYCEKCIMEMEKKQPIYSRD